MDGKDAKEINAGFLTSGLQQSEVRLSTKFFVENFVFIRFCKLCYSAFNFFLQQVDETNN